MTRLRELAEVVSLVSEQLEQGGTMLLAIDVGNTHTVMGLFGDATDGTDMGLIDHWRIATQEQRTADELALLLRSFLRFEGRHLHEISGVAISSVVPRVTVAMRQMVDRYLKVDPVVVEPGTRSGMPILYDNPKEVGADRIANAVAAFDGYGGPAVVVDFGTATTFDAISAEGEYLGGAISPGIEISSRALFDAAAGLKRVELGEPRNVIGKNTVESIQSGMLYGFAGQVDAMVSRIRAEFDGEGVAIATGGLAQAVMRACATIDHYDAWLTLKGLRIIFERNQ